MWKKLPWLDPFLEAIEDEYRKPPPQWTLVEPEQETYNYIYSVADEEDKFDTLQLKKECGSLLKSGEATVYRCVSPLGEILLVSLKKDPTMPSWNLWWRCVRVILTKKKRARILLFGHPKQRTVPFNHEPIQESHVNGGATYPCNEKTIVIYRKEEMTRVILHELFHASCSDPYHEDTPHIEADTEAWAELVLCAMAAKGKKAPFIQYMNEQLIWSVNQAEFIRIHHNVNSEEDYAWRYLVGRLDVWKSLGIALPQTPYKSIKTLRFTICEPDDV